MRRLWLIPWLVGGLLLSPSAIEPAHAQFNPGGRTKKPAPSESKPSPPPPGTSKPSPTQPGTIKPSSPDRTPSDKPTADTERSSPDTTEARRAVLIERYRRLVLDQPGEAHPIERLRELVLARDGSLDALIGEWTALSEKEGVARYSALVALGALAERSGRSAEAEVHYSTATELHPERSAAWLSRARLADARGEVETAELCYRRAIPLLRGGERELVLRRLRQLYLERGEFDRAKQAHRELLSGGPPNVFLAGELGRELLDRNHPELAVTELREVAQKFEGDARALVPALRDLARAELAANEPIQAERTLSRAARLAVSQPGLRSEIDRLAATAARQQGKLEEYLSSLEKQIADAPRLRLLAQLYEEIGRTELAIQKYEIAIQRNPKDLDSRLDLLRLLEQQGQLERVTEQYATLTRAAPDDVTISIKYMRALLVRGELTPARREFDRIEPRTRDMEELLQLLEFTERLESPERKSRLLARIEARTPQDPTQLVELGSRYYREGQTDQAYAIWQKILTVPGDRARAHVTYGEVLLDHDRTQEALDALEKALTFAPSDRRVRRSLALGLERALTQDSNQDHKPRLERALSLWRALLQDTTEPTDAAERQRIEARRHIVRLWQRGGRLESHVALLRNRVDASPNSTEPGKLLAEVLLKLNRKREAEALLRELQARAPGDKFVLQSLISLEEQSRSPEQVLQSLERLLELDPSGARAHLERMARIANHHRLDARALNYAERAVALAPTDADAQARLGDAYRTQNRLDAARLAYERALAISPGREDVTFSLVEILTQQSENERASELLLRLVERSAQEEAVSRATQKLKGLAQGASLQKLDELLLRLSITRADRTFYRTLLLEVYEAERQLLELTTRQKGEEGRRAALELEKLGRRALSPLLGALTGTRVEEQRTALALLELAPSEESAQALLQFAKSSAREELRVQAVLTLGLLQKPQLTEALLQFLRTENAWSGRLPAAAAWSLTRLESTQTERALEIALQSRDPLVQTYGALGLGRGTGTLGRESAQKRLRELAEAKNTALALRVASILALRRTPDPSALLETLTSDSHPLIRTAALESWARWVRSNTSKSATTRFEQAFVRAFFDPEREVRVAVTRAARSAWSAASSSIEPSNRALLPQQLSLSQVEIELRAELLQPGDPVFMAEALIRLEPLLLETARLALGTSETEARSVLERLNPEPSASGFSIELGPPQLEEPRSARRIQLEAVRARLVSALNEDLLRLSAHPDPTLRSLVLGLLKLRSHSTHEQQPYRGALRSALFDSGEAPRKAAISALVRDGSSAATELLSELYEAETRWNVRRDVVEALLEIARSAPTEPERASARRALQKAKRDPSSLVRQALEGALSLE